MLDEHKFNAELKRLAMASIRARQDRYNLAMGFVAMILVSAIAWSPLVIVLWMQK